MITYPKVMITPVRMQESGGELNVKLAKSRNEDVTIDKLVETTTDITDNIGETVNEEELELKTSPPPSSK